MIKEYIEKNLPEVLEYASIGERVDFFMDNNTTVINFNTAYQSDMSININQYQGRITIEGGYGTRSTNYKTISKAFDKRILYFLEMYKERYELEEINRNEHLKIGEKEQARIDELHDTYGSCIVLKQESKYLPPIPILVIGKREYYIDLDKNTMEFNSTYYNTIGNDDSKIFPLHLAIELLQQQEMYNLITGESYEEWYR